MTLTIANKVPYKYDMTKFVNVGSISVDHIDPSIFCVLTAKSRDPTAPLADFLIFSPRWDVASSIYPPSVLNMKTYSNRRQTPTVRHITTATPPQS